MLQISNLLDLAGQSWARVNISRRHYLAYFETWCFNYLVAHFDPKLIILVEDDLLLGVGRRLVSGTKKRLNRRRSHFPVIFRKTFLRN